MDNIAIVTDTTTDIPVSLARNNNITIIPLYVGYEGKLYKEEKEIINKEVYEKVTISLGLIVLEAAKAVKSGVSEEKIDHLIDILIDKSKFFGAIENFEYLFKGGRAPFLGKFLSSAIRFKPILTIDRNGKIKLKKFTRSKRNATAELYKQAKKAASSTYKNEIGIFYGSDRNAAIALEKMVKDDNDIEIDELIITEITTIMSAHTGPGIWGIGICPKVELHKL